MALTVRTNGSGGSNIITASWFNDYYNLLTGAMTDQPVTLNYTPGSSTTTPTLQLESNGNADLMQGTVSGSLKFKLSKTGQPQDGSNHFYAILMPTGSATAGRQIFVGTSTPTGANEGDIWVKA